MYKIRLWRVQRPAVVTNVLGAEKHAKGQAVEKVPRRKQAGHGTHAKVGTTLEELANVLLLRDLIAAVSAVLLHEV